MKNLITQARERLKDRQTRWFLRWLGKWALLIAAVVLYTTVVCRVSEAREARKYEAWKTEWVEAQAAEARAALEADPETVRLNSEASLLARVLYGVRDNDSDDLRTMCWCVFNRVDNAAYPATLTEVIAQPGQWMRYSPENPVLESLYQIAREQIEAWRTGGRRPVGNEYVFMAWSSDDICLRDTFTVGSKTRYWRWGQ